MLDDLKLIHHRDTSDALGTTEKQWQQIEQNFEIKGPVTPEQFSNIVFAGMGGSALAALLSTSWPGYNVPFEICRNYDIPAYVGPNTLFFASSYSGNTEETLAALDQAADKGARIAVITSGGKLAEHAIEKQYPHVLLPASFQPRYATLYNLKALLTLLDGFGINQGAQQQLAAQSEWFKEQLSGWRPDVPASKNTAKQLAQELMGKSVVIYAGSRLFPAAYKWKISINENAKNIAWCNVLPEFNHNEMLGWTSHPTDKPYGVVELRSSLEHERVLKRFEVTERLLSGQRPAPHVIEVQGGDILQQLLWATALGDFVSIYLAILNGLDPTPVELIEKFKQSLDQ